MLARLFLGTEEKQRAHRAMLLGSVLLGLGLRFFNYAIRPSSLWQDEAYWAVKVLKTAAIDAQIRPVGFMLVTQWLLRTVKVAAAVYRALPFTGAVVSMTLAPYVALRLFRGRWSQLLSVLLIAASPVLLEMAVEFKHYGTEVGVYVGLLAAVLHHREKRTVASFVGLLVLAWASFFFSITVIFLYPALFTALLWDAWRLKNWRHAAATAAVALVCLGTITTIYFTTWHTIKTGKAENKWGTWYDVFYLKNGLKTTYKSRPTWTAAKYFELAAAPGAGRALWESARVPPLRLERLKQVDWALWSALHCAGLAFLLRKRRWLELGLLWTPLLFVTAFNLAGRWPAGAFRTNTFYVPFAIFLCSYACEWLAALPARRRLLAPAAVALIALPTLYFRPGLTEKGLWAKPGNFTGALKLLTEKPDKSESTLIMDFASCRPWDYYTVYDAPIGELGARLRRQYKKRCVRATRMLTAEMARVARRDQGFWMLMTDPRKYDYIQEVARDTCASVDVTWVSGRTHMLLHCKRRK